MMSPEEQAEAMVAATAKAVENKRLLLEEFPDIEARMGTVADLLGPLASQTTLNDLIYRSLLTGAVVVSAMRREAQNEAQEILTRVMDKKT
jgi:hypothetical protein